MGDRRAHLRFQVVGPMPASLVGSETLQMVNVGTSGALVEAALPLPMDAEYRMQLVLEAHLSEATVKVRRVTSTQGALDAPRYRIGLEFLALTREAEEVIRRLVTSTPSQA